MYIFYLVESIRLTVVGVVCRSTLRTYDPHARGLGVVVTNLGSKAAMGKMVIQATLHRTPFDATKGTVIRARPKLTTQDHISALNGERTSIKVKKDGTRVLSKDELDAKTNGFGRK
jgi:hypothetical protein